MDNAPKNEKLAGFDFNEGGRTFTCSVAALNAGRTEAWWWFRVSPSTHYGSRLSPQQRQWMPDEPAASRPSVTPESEDNHRYAPFRAEATDTQRSVEARVVAYYDNLMERRGQPSHHAWRGRPR